MKWLPAFAACAVAAWLTVAPFNTSAAAYEVIQLTPVQTRALFGDTLSATYYDTSTGDYLPATFSYVGATTVGQIRMLDDPAALFGQICPSGTRFLIYQSDFLGVEPDQVYYTVRLEPVLNLGLLNQFSVCAGFSSTAYYVQSDSNDPDSEYTWHYGLEADTTNRGGYPFNQWSVLQNGNLVSGYSAKQWTTNSNILDWYSWGICATAQTNTRYFVPNLIHLTSDSYFSVSDIQIQRQGHARATDSSGSRTLLYISCPLLSSNYQDNSSGGQTGTDLTATNLKLDTIIDILSLIASQNNQNSDPGTSDPDVEADADEYADTIDDINDELDILDSAVAAFPNIRFEEATHTEMYSDVRDLVVDGADDRNIFPGTGELPSSLQTIQDELSGKPSVMSSIFAITSVIALLSFVIFGKWS